MAGNIEKGVQGKSANADHRAKSQETKAARIKRKTLPQPPDKKRPQKDGCKPSQLHCGPEPVALGMRCHVFADRMGLRGAENITEIGQTDAD